VGTGTDLPAWIQAFGSIIAIIVAVWSVTWVQDRAASRKEARQLRLQIEALLAIADRCITTISRLDRRAREGTFKRDEVAWLTDEVRADVETVGSVSLLELRSARAVSAVALLHTQSRTALRRIGYVASHLNADKSVDPTFFSKALRQAHEARQALQEIL
jgi:hypothetical protein